MSNNPFRRDPPNEPPPLMEDGLEFAPGERYEFQTASGIIIEKLRFSDMRKFGFVNIVRKSSYVRPGFDTVMCQVIQRCDERELEEVLRHTAKYHRRSFISDDL